SARMERRSRRPWRRTSRAVRATRRVRAVARSSIGRRSRSTSRPPARVGLRAESDMSGNVHPLFPDGAPRAGRSPASPERGGAESDEVLLARVARGDSAGHRLLFDRYLARVTAFLRRRLADAGLCDEVVSDVFFEVWRSASAWRGESSVASWIFGIAHFKALSARRGLSQGQRAAVVPVADAWIERAAGA